MPLVVHASHVAIDTGCSRSLCKRRGTLLASYNNRRLQPTFPGTSLTQLNLIWWCMSPEIQVGKHKETTVTVVVLAWHMSSLAGHGAGLKVMCDTRVLLHPSHRHRGCVLLIQLPLPLHIQVCPYGLTDHRQVVAAACACRRLQRQS